MERAHKQGCKKIACCFRRFPNSEARTIGDGARICSAIQGAKYYVTTTPIGFISLCKKAFMPAADAVTTFGVAYSEEV